MGEAGAGNARCEGVMSGGYCKTDPSSLQNGGCPPTSHYEATPNCVGDSSTENCGRPIPCMFKGAEIDMGEAGTDNARCTGFMSGEYCVTGPASLKDGACPLQELCDLGGALPLLVPTQHALVLEGVHADLSTAS